MRYNSLPNIVLYVCLLACMTIFGVASAAMPTAGTEIKNIAEAEYYKLDTNGTPLVFIKSQSNLDANGQPVPVTVTVKPSLALLLTETSPQLRSPDETFVWQHLLTNTSNTTDSYTLAIADLGGDNGVLQNLSLIHDVNNNGQVDDGDVELTPASVITLARDKSASILIRARIPQAVIAGDDFDVQLTVRNTQTDPALQLAAVRKDTVSVLGPYLRLTKTVDKAQANLSSTTPGANLLSYGLSFTNTGTVSAVPTTVSIDGQNASRVIVEDPLPPNVLFKGISYSGGGQVLYRKVGAGPKVYNLYDAAKPPAATQVGAIAIAFTDFAVGRTEQATLSVQLFNNAVGATISNQYQAFYHFGVEDRSSLSNTVQTTVSGQASLKANDQNYNLVGRIALTGNLFLEANCAQCNVRANAKDRIFLQVVSEKSGDVERVVAIETGDNTGVFRINDDNLNPRDALPSRDMFSNPIVHGNYIIETTKHDKLVATILYCLDDNNVQRPGSNVNASTNVLVDPFGVVFDSKTNQPIKGAVVRLVNDDAANSPAQIFDDSGFECSPNRDPRADAACQGTITTGNDGAYRFPLVKVARYRLIITPPTGYSYPSVVPVADMASFNREIKVDGSYGKSFPVTPEGPVEIDVPMDPPLVFSSTLFVRKTVARSTVEIGDFADYQVTVRNVSTTNTPALKVLVVDNLPQGFSYVPGSVRIDKKPAPEPLGANGPQLTFSVGDVTTSKEVLITYRAAISAPALRGTMINRVRAQEGVIGGIYSNEASVKVSVLPGVFTAEGFVTGKVYTDCNRNGVQDPEEIGVPGVRLLIEDGTYIVTDVEGKYDFYGLRPKTHVLKLDRTTLPPDVELIEQNVRNAGDPASRFVDLKAGELQRADFALTTGNATCTGPGMTEIYRRRNQGDRAIGELERALKADLSFETVNPTDVRSLPASGCIVANGQDCGVRGKAQLPTLSSAAKASDDQVVRTEVDRNVRELESYLEVDGSNRLEILNLKDQQVLPYAQTAILFKGALGARFELTLNGEEVPESSIGKRVAEAAKQMEAREYIGINLVPGLNRISLKQFDPMGNIRGTSVINVTAPGGLAGVTVAADKKILEANGENDTVLRVKLLDKDGVLVTTRTQVTLETDQGRFRAADLDPKAPGTQLFIEGGEFAVKLVSPTEPGEAHVRVSSGRFSADTQIRFVPELRPMVAAGIIEGMVSFKNFDTNKVSAANARDGFEDELQSLASGNDGRLNAGGRAALYLKGKVRGDYLLTLAYDSDKAGNQRLFRDIRPDEFYPVYGDSAVKGFDAQSTSKLYVRLDKGRSYAMFGDYTTRLENDDALALGQYSRSLTGARGHYETDTFKASAFAAQTQSKQVVVEVPAQGVSGPYALTGIDGMLVNSEKVEIILRDRNNPGLILSAASQSRFSDYEFEPLTASLYFKSPVPSLDANLNPYSIRVTVEVQDNAGPDYWVGGVQAEKKLGSKLSVGAAVVEEDNPTDEYRLGSANTTLKFSEHTKLIAEVAQSERDSKGTGQAQRVELNHDKGRTNLRVYYGESDTAFDNPAAPLSSGRSESGMKLQLRLNDWGTFRTEAVRSENGGTGGVRQGVQASLERKLNKYASFEFGGRYYDETQQPSTLSSLGATPYNGVTAHGKLNLQIPKVDGASAFVEYEQDIDASERQMAAVGGDYKLGKQGRVYARHEFISSLSGNFGLNDQQQRNSTVFGMESDYMKDGRVFSEYRVRDAINARDAEAAIGLRNRWYVGKDVRLNTNLERVTTLEGPDSTDSTAVSLGLEYLANPLWKATGKIDLRWADQADSILNTLGLAYKLSRDWTLLARNTFNYADNHTAGDRLQDRFQLGAAYRQVDTNRWDTLTKLEYKLEQDESSAANLIDRDAYIFSTHVNYHPVRRWTLAGHYAGKWVQDTRDGRTDDSDTHMLGARAIHDLTERWEASVQGGWIAGNTGGKRYVLGAETGYLVTTNLWLSAGYNFMSYNDEDLVGNDFTVEGVYLRMRFKFDEDLFRADRPATNKTLEPNDGPL